MPNSLRIIPIDVYSDDVFDQSGGTMAKYFYRMKID